MVSFSFDTKKPAFIISMVFFALATMLILFSLRDMFKNNHKIDFRLLFVAFLCLVAGSFLLENSSNPFKKGNGNGNGDEDDQTRELQRVA
jgi:hypothetical protein